MIYTSYTLFSHITALRTAVIFVILPIELYILSPFEKACGWLRILSWKQELMDTGRALAILHL